MNSEKIYIEKRGFVKGQAAILCDALLYGIESIEYKNISDKYSELLRFKYRDEDKYRFIDVTGNSLKAIGDEIKNIAHRWPSDAEIKHPTHLAMTEGWWEAAK